MLWFIFALFKLYGIDDLLIPLLPGVPLLLAKAGNGGTTATETPPTGGISTGGGRALLFLLPIPIREGAADLFLLLFFFIIDGDR